MAAVSYHLLACFLGSTPKRPRLTTSEIQECLLLSALLRYATDRDRQPWPQHIDLFIARMNLLEQTQGTRWRAWVISFSHCNQMQLGLPIKLIRLNQPHESWRDCVLSEWSVNGRNYGPEAGKYERRYERKITPTAFREFQQFAQAPTSWTNPDLPLIPPILGHNMLVLAMKDRSSVSQDQRTQARDYFVRMIAPYLPAFQYSPTEWIHTFSSANDLGQDRFYALTVTEWAEKTSTLLSPEVLAPYFDAWKYEAEHLNKRHYRDFLQTCKIRNLWASSMWNQDLGMIDVLVPIILAYWRERPLPARLDIERLLRVAGIIAPGDLSEEDQDDILWLTIAQPVMWPAWVLSSLVANQVLGTQPTTDPQEYIQQWRVRRTGGLLVDEFKRFRWKPTYALETTYEIPQATGQAFLVAALLGPSVDPTAPTFAAYQAAHQFLQLLEGRRLVTMEGGDDQMEAWLLSFALVNELREPRIQQLLSTPFRQNNWQISQAEQAPYFTVWKMEATADYHHFKRICVP